MTPSHPSVTVLLPVYNDAAYLRRAVASIERQSLRDWEMLLLDDGSTDETPELVEELARKDPRVLARHLPHRGIAAALNTGLADARGRYLARMDADDVSHPHRLALQAAFLDERPDIGVLGCRVRIFPRSPVPAGMAVYEEWLNSVLTPEEIARDMFVESPLAHPSVMLRREALERAGGYRNHGPEDYDLWLRLHRKGCRFAKVAKTLLWWMDRPLRLSRTGPQYSREAFRRCKARHLASLLGPGAPVLIAGNREAKRLSSRLAELGIRVQAYLDLNPGRLRARAGGVPVLPYESLRGRKPDCMVLAAVGSWGARHQIRSRLTSMGYRELEDFICVG